MKLELWLVLASIVLLPKGTWFSFSFAFLTVYLQLIDESSGFQGFCIYIETNQLIFIITITYLASVWSVRALRVRDSMGTLVRYRLLKFQ